MIALFWIFQFGACQECFTGNCFEYCRVRYQGMRSYFNQSDRICYPVKSCKDGEVYVYEDNSCVGESEPPEVSGEVNNTEEYYQDKKIVCVHGKMVGKMCYCDKGFFTSRHQDPSQSFVKMCDTKEKPKDVYSQGKNGEIYLNNAEEDDLVEVKLDPLYKIIILVGGFLGSCCLSCCYVRRLKKRLLTLPV
jgi:hypothetical protein